MLIKIFYILRKHHRQKCNITYYKNNQKHKKRKYKNGKREGAFIEWDEKGKKIKEEIFRENVLIRAIYYKL